MQIDNDGVWLNHTKPEAGPVLFGRTTNNPAGGSLQAISHSKETFMKANVIWGVRMLKKLRVRIATRNKN